MTAQTSLPSFPRMSIGGSDRPPTPVQAIRDLDADASVKDGQPVGGEVDVDLVGV